MNVDEQHEDLISAQFNLISPSTACTKIDGGFTRMEAKVPTIGSSADLMVALWIILTETRLDPNLSVEPAELLDQITANPQTEPTSKLKTFAPQTHKSFIKTTTHKRPK